MAQKRRAWYSLSVRIQAYGSVLLSKRESLRALLVLVPDTNLQPHRQLEIRFGAEAGISKVYFQRCRCPISPSGLTGGVAGYQLMISKM
jgi:hypothetical protein